MAIKFRQEVIDHNLPGIIGKVLILQPLSHTVFTGVTIAFFLGLALLLAMGEYSRKVQVVGHLSPDQGTIKVYGPTLGNVSSVLVVKGQSVKTGDPLIFISNEQGVVTGSDLQSELIEELKLELSSLEIKQKNAAKRWNHVKEKSLKEAAAHQRELQILQTQYNIKKQKVEIASERVDSISRLRDQTLISEDQKLMLREALLDAEMGLLEIRRSMAFQRKALGVVRVSLNQLPIQESDELVGIESARSTVKQKIKQLDAARTKVLRAPQNGFVSAVHASVGSNAGSSTPLVTIIPEGSLLEAHLYIPSRAAGFIELEQEVHLKYDAFAYQKFGVANAEVVSMSDTILSPSEVNAPVRVSEAVYRAVCRIQDQTVSGYGRQWPLQEGMTLTAEIVLQPRTLWRWILDPLYSATSSF